MRLTSLILLVLVITASCAPAFAEPPVGIKPVGSRPHGVLDGKIVYTHGGHGYTADNEGAGGWTTQRPLYLGMAEDLGNKDQMDLFVEELFRAGATIVPLRPVGHQPNEVVLDNLDSEVTYFGDWQDSLAEVGFGLGPGPAYRFAKTSATETATARFTPRIPKAGVYPVYAWATPGSNRASDQIYRIHHTGGATEVTVNHRRVGNGLVYLGSYYFAKGKSGSVEVSNHSADSEKVVIADMIRFGNGRGDIDRGGGVSGLSREEEAGLYWIMWHVDRARGITAESYRASPTDRSATVSLSPRYAAFMNREQEGPTTDRVFVSFHSNAGSGKARGVLGLYNGNNYATSRTPQQLLLTQMLAEEVNTDLVAQAGHFEHDWYDRGNGVTLDRADIEFGEINNKYIKNEFDATIVETGFHDNQQDAEMLRDPRVRKALARATCQGLIKYFHEVDGGQTPVVALPPPVTHVTARSLTPGAVTLRWKPPKANPVNGDKATGYVVYTSVDGTGFDSGRAVAGGGTTHYTVAGLDPASIYAFRIAARNGAGVSEPSEVLVSTPVAASPRVLVVEGFDRLDRQLNAKRPYRGGGEGGVVERVWPDWSNPRKLSAMLAADLHAAAFGLAIDAASNEAVAAGEIDLTDYDALFWSLGEESFADKTFDKAEQAAVSEYLAQGGKLFVSGSNLAWDLDRLRSGREFCRQQLHTKIVRDDADTYEAHGVENSLFAGLNLKLSDGSEAYDVASPDVLAPTEGATVALKYAGGGAAAVQFAEGDQPGAGKVVVLGFPVEMLNDSKDSTEVARRVLKFFGVLRADEKDASHTDPAE